MTDLQDRLPDLLGALARDAEAERLALDPARAARTLRRARRRRTLVGAVATVGVVAIVLGGLAGARSLLDASGRSTIGGAGTGPTSVVTGPPGAVTGATGAGEPPVTGSDGAVVPDAVEATRTAIIAAIEARDLEALAPLIDPNTFVYNFDDGSDPLPLWREDPSVLDVVPALLRMPFVVKEIEGYGTFYVWPYLVDADLTELTARERADLAALGIDEAELAQMLEHFGGYAGPRTAIDADGLWRNFVVGGD
jgi:hypothetical protein